MKVTADDIARLLASAPPRQVPAHVLRAARRDRASVGTLLVGLGFAAIGLVFSAVFFPWRFADEWRLAAGADTAAGVVRSANDTNMKVNGRRVMEYQFTFSVPGGAAQTGACFANAGRWAVNDPVTVRYLLASPALACIEGARLNEAGWAGAFVIIFPVVGGGMVAWFAGQRRQIGRLLHAGIVAEVDVVSVNPTNLKVNKRPVYAIVLAGPSLGAQPVTVKRMNDADLTLADRRAEEKQPLFVFHDPRKPARLIFPEALIDP